MKKLFFVLVSLAFNVSFSQIPSINETKSDIDTRNSSNIYKELDSLKVNLSKLSALKTKLEAEVKKTVSFEINSLINEKIKEIEEVIEKDNKKLKIENKKISINNNFLIAFDQEIIKLDSIIEDLTTKQKNTISDLTLMNEKLVQIDANKNLRNYLLTARNKKLKSLTYSWFLPTINKEKRADFFKLTYNNNIEKTNYINSFAILGNDDGYLAQSEIITDNLNAFRVSFGSIINAKTSKTEESTTTNTVTLTEEEIQKDALNRLFNGGGNLYLDLILPLMTSYDGSATDYLTSYTYFNSRVSMDVKGFGNNIDTSTGNGSFGFNSYASISSDSKKFNFFVQGSVNYNFGSNDYYKNLGIKNEQGFLNGKVIVGVGLLNHFKVTAIVNTFGSDEKLRSGKVNIGIQVLPGN